MQTLTFKAFERPGFGPAKFLFDPQTEGEGGSFTLQLHYPTKQLLVSSYHRVDFFGLTKDHKPFIDAAASFKYVDSADGPEILVIQGVHNPAIVFHYLAHYGMIPNNWQQRLTPQARNFLRERFSLRIEPSEERRRPAPERPILAPDEDARALVEQRSAPEHAAAARPADEGVRALREAIGGLCSALDRVICFSFGISQEDLRLPPWQSLMRYMARHWRWPPPMPLEEALRAIDGMPPGNPSTPILLRVLQTGGDIPPLSARGPGGYSVFAGAGLAAAASAPGAKSGKGCTP